MNPCNITQSGKFYLKKMFYSLWNLNCRFNNFIEKKPHNLKIWMFSLALHQSLYLYIYIECLILFICSCFYFYEVNSAYPFWGLFAVVLSHNLLNHPLLWASCIKTVNLDIKMSISVYFSLLPPCSNCLNE